MKISKIKEVFSLLSGAYERNIREFEEWLTWYEALVIAVPDHVAKAFGKIGVYVVTNGEKKEWSIELTAFDFMFWRNNKNVYFFNGANEVKTAIYNRLAQVANNYIATPEERKKLLDILKDE
jgi:hypothetical protein